MRVLGGMLLGAGLLAPFAAAEAAAGQVLFALGRVEIQRAGQSVAAARGAAVEVGDVISTGPTGMAQLRMQDGALLSLRYGSTLQVEDYRMPEPSRSVPPVPATAPVAGSPAPAAAGGRSVLRLLRGAFRTVTGLIGRGGGDAYSVVTPVATIGIRGTDYSAAYCSSDCGATPDGLYLGVSSGGIEVRNDMGALVLGDDQYAYVKDNATPPARELAPPEVLDTPTPPEEGEAREARDVTDAGASGPDAAFRDESGRDVGAGDAAPEGDYEVRPQAAARYAYAGAPFKGSDDAVVYADGRGALLGFSGPFTAASIGTAANFDTGADAATGLYWGRWHGGIARVTTADGTNPLDLGTSSLHWIYALESDAPRLAITGSRSYTLVGSTNPTDSSGAVGTLGSATLSADFTNNMVSSSIDVTFGDVAAGGTQWQASGQGIISSGTFEGTYSTVFVNGQTGGSGGFAGFFSSDGGGAGLVFELTDANFTTTVNGAAAFAEFTRVAGGP